jgi:GNAT superfamily N-acetyltransferase
MLLLTPLAPDHAPDAARLHIAGQPGTFLTSLGYDVLVVIYRALSQSQVGFGFTARMAEVAGGPLGAPAVQPAVAGYISATTSIGRLFVEIGAQRLPELLPPLLATYAHHPTLALRSLQTVLYPVLMHEDEQAEPSAELLSIMVEPALRSHSIGALLIEALLQECRNRHIATVTVTVDTANAGARRFYTRHGFAQWRTLHLYGRAMQVYRRTLSSSAI